MQLMVQASCCECEWAQPQTKATEAEQRRMHRLATKHTESAQHATEVTLLPVL